MPSRLLRRVPPALIALASAAALASCGGDDETVQRTLDSFNQPIGSADVALSAEVALEGGTQAAEPIRVQVNGPYVSGPEDGLPSFDWDLSVAGGGASTGGIPPVGLISTGDNAFVEVGGTAYEVGEEAVASSVADQTEDEAQGLAAFGIDPRSWIVDAQSEGTEEVAGVETDHVSGSIDVPRMLADLNRLAQETGGTVGGETPPALTEEQIQQADDVIGEPRFDLFAGADDGKMRRLTAGVDFTAPETAQTGLGGVTGGTLSFSLELSNVGGPQEITAPTDARPIDDLTKQLGDLGGLLGQGLSGGQPGATPSLPTPPTTPGAPAPQTPAPQTPAPSPEGGAGATPEADAFREYGECIQKADPQDQQELQECSQLLSP